MLQGYSERIFQAALISYAYRKDNWYRLIRFFAIFEQTPQVLGLKEILKLFDDQVGRPNHIVQLSDDTYRATALQITSESIPEDIDVPS